MSNNHTKDKYLSVKYKELLNGLFSYGRKYTRNFELVKDCIQDVFLALLEKEDISNIRSINFYILRAFRNKLLYELRREPFEDICETSYNYLYEPSVEDHLIETEEIKMLETCFEQAFNTLSRRQKRLIRLYYINQLSYNEICQSENITYQTAKNIISQAITRLRKMMG